MTLEKEINSKIIRHKKFWQREKVKRPLISTPSQFEMDTAEEKLKIEEGPLSPEDINEEMFVYAYEQLFEKNGILAGDMFRVASASRLPYADEGAGGSTQYKISETALIPWGEAFVGCPIHASPNAIYAKTPEVAPNSNSNIEENRWFQKALEVTNALASKFKGKYPVAPPFVRGPADMISALLGNEQLCFDLIDNSARVELLGNICTNSWLQANSIFKENAPKYFNGYLEPRFQTWAPDYIFGTQEDAAIFFSPKLYNRYLVSLNEQIFANIPYSIIHIHTETLYTVEPLLNIPDLSAIQVHFDIKGPTTQELLPIFESILKVKPLILYDAFNKKQIEEFLNLPSQGLCLMAQTGSDKEAIELLEGMVKEDE